MRLMVKCKSFNKCNIVRPSQKSVRNRECTDLLRASRLFGDNRTCLSFILSLGKSTCANASASRVSQRNASSASAILAKSYYDARMRMLFLYLLVASHVRMIKSVIPNKNLTDPVKPQKAVDSISVYAYYEIKRS